MVRYFCKRPCFHDAYPQTFNRDNVTTGRHPRAQVQRPVGRQVVVDDVLYELPTAWIFATGFEVGTDHRPQNWFSRWSAGTESC